MSVLARRGAGSQPGGRAAGAPVPPLAAPCAGHASLRRLLLSPVTETGAGYEEEDDEISPDLWQEACWIVIR